MSWNCLVAIYRYALLLFLTVLLTLCFTAFVGILTASEGQAWTDLALNVGFYAAILSLTVAAALSYLIRSKALRVLTGAFALIYFVAFGRAVLICFPGTGSRFSNCGADAFTFLGLVVLLFSLCFLLRIAWREVVISMLLVPPLAGAITYRYFASPLKVAIRTVDPSEYCFLSVPAHENGFEGATRINAVSEIGLDLVVGEYSPRIYRLSKHGISKWIYSERRFVDLWTVENEPFPCPR